MKKIYFTWKVFISNEKQLKKHFYKFIYFTYT